MRVLFAATLALTLSGGLTEAAAAAPPAQAENYRQAFRKAEQGDIAGAKALVAATPDKLLDKVLAWQELTKWRGGSFDTAAAFLKSNPDWPSQNALKLRAEEGLVLNPNHGQVLEWFAAYPPASRDGRIRLANAMRATGREAEGVALLRKVWVEDNFGAAEEKSFVVNYGNLIEPRDEAARLDRLLWRNQTDAAKRQMMRVDAGWRALAEARIALAAAAPGADGALQRVPPSHQSDSGLLWAKLKYDRIKNRDADARAILLKPPANLVRPDLWWEERQIEVRRAIAAGDNGVAYRMARDHRLTEGNDFAEAEWLAGWAAMRGRDPKGALPHFKNLHANGRHPVYQARGAYWAGRALEQMGQAGEAREWYARSARHVTTFYGQIAATRLGQTGPVTLPPDPAPAEADVAAFNRREVPQVVRRLAAIGEPTRIDPFVLRLVEVAEKPEQMVLASRLARDTGRRDLAVTVARRAFRDGVTLIDTGFPTLEVPDVGGPEKALVHAVIRQESNFAPDAISRAGARGLMQLMPSTAKWMAGKISLGYSEPLLTADPTYNMTLGQAYLSGVLDNFAGSYLLAAAAYNAGPGRVRQWIREFGDPRDNQVDVLDWIEQIPFNETRNYVQRVLEAVHVYRLRTAAHRPATQVAAAARPAGAPSAQADWCLLVCAPHTVSAGAAPAAPTPGAAPAGIAPPGTAPAAAAPMAVALPSGGLILTPSPGAMPLPAAAPGPAVTAPAAAAEPPPRETVPLDPFSTSSRD